LGASELSEWKKILFKDICTLKRGKDLTKAQIKEGIHPVVTSSGIIGYHNEYISDGPGVVVGRSGSVGRVQFIDKPFWAHNTALYVTDFKGNDPYYLYNLFKTLNLESYNGGTSVPTLNRNHLDNIEVKVPDLQTQLRISEALKQYDELIINLINTNELLEAYALTLYQYYFVDFVPFSDGEFEENELLKIPKGWKTVSVYDLATYINGKVFKSKELSEDGIPVVKIAELKNGIGSTTRYFKGDIADKYKLQNGDILFAWSASLGIYIWTKGEAVLNQHIFNVKVDSGYDKSIVYFALKEIIQEYIEIAASRATTMGHITKDHLINKKIILPSISESEKYAPKFRQLFCLIEDNHYQIRKLQETQDFLLQRLISGELII
jgi:type I restriction enzyme, S subunit